MLFGHEKKKEPEKTEQGRGRENTPSTCLNIKLLQKAADGLWGDKTDGWSVLSVSGGAGGGIMLEYTASPSPEIVSTPSSVGPL